MNPEDLLSGTLREQTEQTDYPSTPLAAVVSRARAVRRRRARTATLAAAAAVAVVVAPTAIWLSHSPGSSSGPATSSTSTAPTASTSHPQKVSLSSLPVGPKPGIDYLVGDTYVEMGGGHETAPAFAHATSVALGRGGILVATPRGGSGLADISLVTGQQSQSLGCGSSSFAITPDRVMTAYWLADSCADPSAGGKLYPGVDNTMGDSGPEGLTTPPGLLETPVGMLKADVLASASSADGSPAGAWDFGDGIAPRRVPGLLQAYGVAPDGDRVSGTLADGSGGVVDTLTGKVAWSTGSWQLGQFSDDGRYVLGRQSRNGPLSDGYAVFDARTGVEVTELGPFPSQPDAVPQVAWDVQDAVLAVVSDGSHEAIVRYDLQGHGRRATPVIDVSGSDLGYRLATRP